jgi:hypothetical protein
VPQPHAATLASAATRACGSAQRQQAQRAATQNKRAERASAAAFKRARLYSLETAAPSISRMTIAKMDIMLQKVAPAPSGATQSAHERTPRN